MTIDGCPEKREEKIQAGTLEKKEDIVGILTGHEVLFFLLGVLSTLLVFGLVHFHKRYVFSWYAMAIAALASFLIVFTIAWWISGIQEGEVQSGNLGLLVFGLPALLLFGITRRLITKKGTAAQSR